MNKHNERAELKPCPFCGEAHDLTVHVYGTGEDDAYVQCRECTTCGPDGGDREGAIVKWNQRAAMLEAQPAEQRTIEETVHYLSGKIDGKIEMLNIETAFAEQENGQEAVGQLLEEQFGRGQVMWFKKPADGAMLYTTPPAQPAREWVSLTHEERLNIIKDGNGPWSIAAGIESKLRKKNDFQAHIEKVTCECGRVHKMTPYGHASTELNDAAPKPQDDLPAILKKQAS